MDDRAEVYGTEGVAYADLLHGNALHDLQPARLRLRGREGGPTRGLELHRSTRKPGTTASRRRWRTSSSCVRDDRPPLVTGEDGRAVLEVIFAAYASAGRRRRIELPFASPASRPIELWKGAHP